MNWRIPHDYAPTRFKAGRRQVPGQDGTATSCGPSRPAARGADLHTNAIKNADGNHVPKFMRNFRLIVTPTGSLITPRHRRPTPMTTRTPVRPASGPQQRSGLRRPCMPHMMGCRGAQQVLIEVHQPGVEPKHSLGKEGQGMRSPSTPLSAPAHIAMSNLGMAQRMLEISLKRANDRITFASRSLPVR